MKLNNTRLFTAAFGIAMLVLAVGHAAILDINIDESKLKINSTVSALNYTFNVTGDERIYISNGDEVTKFRIVFLENLDMINGISHQIGSLALGISAKDNLSSQVSDMIDYKTNDNIVLGQRLDSLQKETAILSQQSNSTQDEISSIELEKKDLESRMTGNFLVSTGQTTALLFIFTVLIAAVIAIELKAYFGSGTAGPKHSKNVQAVQNSDTVIPAADMANANE